MTGEALLAPSVREHNERAIRLQNPPELQPAVILVKLIEGRAYHNKIRKTLGEIRIFGSSIDTSEAWISAQEAFSRSAHLRIGFDPVDKP